MNFIGPARPLSDGDVSLIAGYLGCHIASVRAVLAVESAGKGFGPDKRPIILNEPHIFYRELGSGSKRNAAVGSGLAYAKWGAKPYPKTQAARYEWLAKAMAIDETAALRSCSYGLGQVMGFNHKVAGFDTVQAFVRAMTLSEGAHLYAMARFIVSNGLQKYLVDRNWSRFANGYNGGGYAKHGYHTKLAAAYAKRPMSEMTTPQPTSISALAAMVSEAPQPPATPPAKPPVVEHPQPKPVPSPVKSEGWLAALLKLIAAWLGRR